MFGYFMLASVHTLADFSKWVKRPGNTCKQLQSHEHNFHWHSWLWKIDCRSESEKWCKYVWGHRTASDGVEIGSTLAWNKDQLEQPGIHCRSTRSYHRRSCTTLLRTLVILDLARLPVLSVLNGLGGLKSHMSSFENPVCWYCFFMFFQLHFISRPAANCGCFDFV